MAVNPFPLVDVWLRYAILFHYDYLGKPDHHDILLEIIQGEDPEQLALDKIESAEQDLTRPQIIINPQELIRRRYLTYEGAMRGNRGFVRRVDEGRYRLTESDQLEFEGRVLRGVYSFDERAEEELYMIKTSPC